MPNSTRAVAWAALSLAAFPLALLATLPLITLPSQTGLGSLIADAGWNVHLVEMALWPIVWGTLSCAAIWYAGRVLLALRAPPRTEIAIAAIGFVLAAWHHVVLQQWQIGRLGIVDPDQVGWTAGLFALLVGIGVAAFGASIAPRSIARLPAALLVIGCVGVLLVAMSNLGGVSDGIRADSVVLAVSLVAACLYSALATLLTLSRVGR